LISIFAEHGNIAVICRSILFKPDNGTLMMETVGVVRVAEQVDNTTFEFHVGETPESLWPGQ